MNFLAGKVVGATETGVTIAPDGVDDHVVDGAAARATGRRPAPGSPSACAPSISRSPPDGAEGLPLTVDMEEDLGGVSYLHARTPSGQPIVLERRGSRENFEGRRIAATAPPDTRLVFDEAGERCADRQPDTQTEEEMR